MIPIISDDVLRFMLFLYLSIRIYWDLLFKIYRWMIGGGNK
jgi:hypothetical protein